MFLHVFAAVLARSVPRSSVGRFTKECVVGWGGTAELHVRWRLFQDVRLLGTTVEYFPYSTQDEVSPEEWADESGEIGGNASLWSGIYPDVAAVMARNLNFTLDLVRETKWGSAGKDGVWSGMMGNEDHDDDDDDDDE